MKTFAIAAVGMLTALGGVAEVRAADPHLDELAADIQNQTYSLVREVRYGYRHHPEFAHLYEDTVEMYNLARRVHDIAHHRVPESHLARAVNDLDELFHHVEEVVEQVDRTGAWRINRYHQQRAIQLMALLEETIHHLQDDLAPVPAAPIRRVVPVQPIQPVLPAPTPIIYHGRPVLQTPYYQGGRQITFGNGRIQVRIGH